MRVIVILVFIILGSISPTWAEYSREYIFNRPQDVIELRTCKTSQVGPCQMMRHASWQNNIFFADDSYSYEINLCMRWLELFKNGLLGDARRIYVNLNANNFESDGSGGLIWTDLSSFYCKFTTE
jgi:hypothetical protein